VQPREQFGSNLRRLRQTKNLSQEQLSALSGLHATEISRLERGAREPRLGTIVRLAHGLDVTAADLMAGVG
jgi:transcriptional regulator with XRE-family HTH domain